MSERIYRALLRLYPRRFRAHYGEEALQLFRDRMEDERGWLRRSRLWLDLLLDLGAIRIRGYREATVVGAVTVAKPGAGIPSFASLEVRALETRFLIWGGFLSVVFCGAVLFALQHGGGRLPLMHAMVNSNAPVIKAKEVPKITFSYEPADATGGSMVRLHTVVKANGDGPVPTGKVNFLHGWNIFVDGKLVDGTVTVVAKVPRGKRLPLNALYTGDMNYGSVSSVEKAQ
ncbi:Ig-like domain repeat protein [Edaphobacter albus]|uniref:Ig-like domain repeat protein n=1 Tax=Edaphobacter sp. 4G125 TaxID=2763071 RepID=UPI001648B366|nr:Ig-like domain repeat protein [Edaphobacter sp. 4G125]QNI37394.1 Ig-like domain repeat protein [Edaphobacter sp. 4G125]